MTITLEKPDAPLLFFDTGMGGLSVLRESQKLQPNAPIVYAADYAGMPYGMKSEEELSARVPALLGRLVERYHPQLVTIACNTASTITLDFVRSALDVPVVGTVPAIKPASETTKSGVIGLLGTKATIRQPYVDRLAADFAPDKKMIRFAAPDLVYAAEAKLRGETPDPKVIKEAVEGLISQVDGEKIDVIILACTHFPLVEQELAAVLSQPVTFVHGGQGIARRIKYLTHPNIGRGKRQEGIFVTTGNVAEIAPYRKILDEFGLSQYETL